MQITINVPDNLPLEKVQQIINTIEMQLIKEPALKAKKKRPIGLAKGQFTVPTSFFEPLPIELMRAFEGNDGIKSWSGMRIGLIDTHPTSEKNRNIQLECCRNRNQSSRMIPAFCVCPEGHMRINKGSKWQ
jgi:hypothetical protein